MPTKWGSYADKMGVICRQNGGHMPTKWGSYADKMGVKYVKIFVDNLIMCVYTFIVDIIFMV